MYLTDEKVAVMGAAGAIGSNLAQTLLASGTASQVAMSLVQNNAGPALPFFVFLVLMSASMFQAALMAVFIYLTF